MARSCHCCGSRSAGRSRRSSRARVGSAAARGQAAPSRSGLPRPGRGREEGELRKVLPKIGVTAIPVVPPRLLEAAVLTEELGFESFWVGEHVVTPLAWGSAFPGAKLPFAAKSQFVEPLVALAHVAAATKRVRLGTGVVIL